jgi:hypothetical protein
MLIYVYVTKLRLCYIDMLGVDDFLWFGTYEEGRVIEMISVTISEFT